VANKHFNRDLETMERLAQAFVETVSALST
jgi:hypothetical protein